MVPPPHRLTAGFAPPLGPLGLPLEPCRNMLFQGKEWNLEIWVGCHEAAYPSANTWWAQINVWPIHETR